MISRYVCGIAIAIMSFPAMGGETRNKNDVVWDELRPDIFGARTILDGGEMVILDAPYRAEDAAVTPIAVRTNFGAGRKAVGLTIVIDQNPAPVAATFSFGPSMEELDLATRIRVEAYSYVRAIVETDGGELYMSSAFVRASGGCSAPALKDAGSALRSIGDMRVRTFKAAAPGRVGEAQVMLRHPNYSGLQMDQISRDYISARFVDLIEIKQGSELIWRMEGGISISENPLVRFRYRANDAKAFAVRATDTDGARFEKDVARKTSG